MSESDVIDREQARFDYGHGGVPWFLTIFYIAFLAFFVWYTLAYQLPDYLEQGPIKPPQAEQSAR